ncbi:hypothetical protein [Ensifer sp. YR511]|uniref:hypothetical protein n=1 Tax=Ensifer sp. YR511 TaxID=1855294 RepID=UPI000880E10D|nr:hypothetical protein [Ensifer sp. YR511]SDO22026.1 hypothetical protein SAMN05216328_1694 [Ensifer sp. YR511]
MNFSVHQDTGSEIHGYLVPDGFSTKPIVAVRLNESSTTEIACWLYVEGAYTQGLHETGNVAFILSESNVPGISTAERVEISDVESGLIFYRRASLDNIPRKVLRVETSYVPHSELDLSLKPHFQFFEHRAERHGFETVRQMLEILHQPSIYVSGRILLKNYQVYIDYNIDVTMIGLRDPFYELALRLITFSRYNLHRFAFVPERDKTIFRPVIDCFAGLDVRDEGAVRRAIRQAPKDTLSVLSSPFTQQLMAANPSEPARLDSVVGALDALSQFTLFDAGQDDTSYAKNIAELLGLPEGSVNMRPQLEAVHQLADILREIGSVSHLLESDLILYHFIQKALFRARAKD